jgi:hypothetical protein
MCLSLFFTPLLFLLRVWEVVCGVQPVYRWESIVVLIWYDKIIIHNKKKKETKNSLLPLHKNNKENPQNHEENH